MEILIVGGGYIGMYTARQAGAAAQAFRETLQRAALAAEALALPEPR
jgi:NADH dehydrogenase FAD-containing subunit